MTPYRLLGLSLSLVRLARARPAAARMAGSDASVRTTPSRDRPDVAASTATARTAATSTTEPGVAVDPAMTCTRTDGPDGITLRIDGVLDALTAHDIRAAFDAVVAARPARLTLELDGLVLVDSSGVGAIVSLYKRIKSSGGAMAVTGVQKQPLAVFKLLKLERVFSL